MSSGLAWTNIYITNMYMYIIVSPEYWEEMVAHTLAGCAMFLVDAPGCQFLLHTLQIGRVGIPRAEIIIHKSEPPYVSYLFFSH